MQVEIGDPHKSVTSQTPARVTLITGYILDRDAAKRLSRRPLPC